MANTALETAIVTAITKNGGYVAHGELCPLVAKLGITRDDTGIMQTATNMAERGDLVKPQRGYYYLPEAWAKASPHDRALVHMPFGMCDQGRVLYAFWMIAQDPERQASLDLSHIRQWVKTHFDARLSSSGPLTLLVEDGYMTRPRIGVYKLTPKGREAIKAGLAAHQAAIEAEAAATPAETQQTQPADA